LKTNLESRVAGYSANRFLVFVCDLSQKCDGFVVASNLTDPNLGTFNILHEGEESYNNIWQKVRAMWSFVYDNYYEKYDWFHVGGDDMYLLVENLRLYLESEEILTASNGGEYLPNGSESMQTPLFMGRRFAYQGDMNDIFISGGSGYTINKAALKTLVVNGLPKFMPHAHTFSEDTMVARIFRHFGVYPYETKDESGGERYMPFTPGHHYGYRMPSDPSTDWYARYSINIKEGADHCAKYSVAFHYAKGMDMKRYHALLYGLCTTTTS
jgi:glycoprotein-N-acetylgalactosamine 3-beta-galactosyltransferase